MSLLRRLDQRVLPPVGNALSRLFRGAVRLRAFTTVMAVVAVTGTLLAVHAANRGDAADPTLGDVLRVGVAEGGSIPQYVTAGRSELAGLTGDGPVYALVSFSAYLAPDRLTPVLTGGAVSSVFARLPLPGVQTELVRLDAFKLPADVLAGMDATADRKTAEAAHYRDLYSRADNQPPDVRQVYLSGSVVADDEATAYREHCSCVYAAVVYAGPAALRVIAARPETRVVDPIAELRRLDRTVFLPPLPDQSQVAGPPQDGAPLSPGPR